MSSPGIEVNIIMKRYGATNEQRNGSIAANGGDFLLIISSSAGSTMRR
jgi:hypothetical protein